MPFCARRPAVLLHSTDSSAVYSAVAIHLRFEALAGGFHDIKSHSMRSPKLRDPTLYRMSVALDVTPCSLAHSEALACGFRDIKSHSMRSPKLRDPTLYRTPVALDVTPCRLVHSEALAGGFHDIKSHSMRSPKLRDPTLHRMSVALDVTPCSLVHSEALAGGFHDKVSFDAVPRTKRPNITQNVSRLVCYAVQLGTHVSNTQSPPSDLTISQTPYHNIIMTGTAMSNTTSGYFIAKQLY